MRRNPIRHQTDEVQTNLNLCYKNIIVIVLIYLSFHSFLWGNTISFIYGTLMSRNINIACLEFCLLKILIYFAFIYKNLLINTPFNLKNTVIFVSKATLGLQVFFRSSVCWLRLGGNVIFSDVIQCLNLSMCIYLYYLSIYIYLSI